MVHRPPAVQVPPAVQAPVVQASPVVQAPPAVQVPTPHPPTATTRADIDPPTRPVEYLTVRLDPDPVERGFGDTMDVPAAAMPRMRQASPDDQSPPGGGFRRGPAILLGVAVLVVIVVVAVVASIVATGVDSDRGRTGALQTGETGADAFGGTPPDSLAQVSAARASALLKQAGERPAGKIKQGFTWKDDNGLNLMATLSDPTTKGITLTVVHVAGLDSEPRTLRTMVDPNLPACTGVAPRAGFTTGSMFVRDLNGDGVAEVTIGWSSRCGDADTSPSLAKLALISDGAKYIIRGDGVIGKDGSGTPAPAPGRSNWPKDFLSAATTLYSSLYF